MREDATGRRRARITRLKKVREEVEEVKEEVMEEVKEAEMGKIAVKTRTALIIAVFEAEAAIENHKIC